MPKTAKPRLQKPEADRIGKKDAESLAALAKERFRVGEHSLSAPASQK